MIKNTFKYKSAHLQAYILFVIFNFACATEGMAQFAVGKNTASLPRPDHVVVLIFENHGYGSIIGSPAAPHINVLANDSNTALFTHSYAITHPSQPNYLCLFSGRTQGVNSDTTPSNYPFTTDNLAHQLLDAAWSFTTYSEDLPSVGFNGDTWAFYARKHNPVSNWVGTGTNQVPDTLNQSFSAFPVSNYAQLPTVSFVVPNLVNDMHNGTGTGPISAGDNWLDANLDGYIQWARNNNSLLIITFDEDDNSHSNHIVTLFYGPMVQGGRYDNTIDHYNVLRTIEEMYTLPYAGFAALTTSITNCWKQLPAAVENAVKENRNITVAPNPADHIIRFDAGAWQGNYSINITDITGQRAGSYLLSPTNKEINTSAYTPGIYFYTAYTNAAFLGSGKFIVAH